MLTGAFLTIRSKKLGEIKGNVEQRFKEGYIELVSVNHEFISPRDAATGQATGRRIHKPISFVKEVDNLTPVFNRMLAENIEIDEASFLFYGALKQRSLGYAAGEERLIYSIILKNAFVSMSQLTLHNLQQQEHKPVFVEQIGLLYKQIEWVWAQGNIAATDEWGLKV